MKDFLNITKALADENRLRMLMALQDGELCVCQLTELMGLAMSTVSKHLSVLYQAGLVNARKEGRWMYYSLPGKGAPTAAREAVAWVRRSLAGQERMAEDAKRLKKVLAMDLGELCKTAVRKLKVLFLCTGNSCRSQMAEGWARALKGDVLEAYSAGIEKHGMNPHAVRVMAEAGVDISQTVFQDTGRAWAGGV